MLKNCAKKFCLIMGQNIPLLAGILTRINATLCKILTLPQLAENNCLNKNMKNQIINLWHIAKSAGNNSRYDRMLYVHKELKKLYPSESPKKLWLEIDKETRV